MKAVLICGGIIVGLVAVVLAVAMESVCAGMPRPSWNIIDVAQADFCFLPFWERSDQQPLTACGGGYFMPKSWILELRQE